MVPSNSTLVSVYPSSLHFFKFHAYNKEEKKRYNPNSFKNLEENSTGGKLSKKGVKNIKRSIETMFELSVKRKVTLKTGKVIPSFRLAFITLTLPSKQIHDDLTIKSRCLNQFFVELRRNYGIKNYVWKAELQGNDNIHFHIVVDKPVNYYELRTIWNRIIEKLGYITAYQKKFENLTFKQYRDYKLNLEKELILTGKRKSLSSSKDLRSQYITNKRNHWRKPSTVNVKSTGNVKSLSGYLSKYLSKEIQSKEEEEEEPSERVLKFGRIWYRSTSLSKLSKVKVYGTSELIEMLYKELKKAKALEVVTQYCKSFYLNTWTLTKSLKSFISELLWARAFKDSYEPPEARLKWDNITPLLHKVELV